MIRLKTIEKEEPPCESPAVGAEDQSFMFPLALLLQLWNAPSATPGQSAPTQVGSQSPKMGRPMIGAEGETITAQRPWKAMGMSRSTWYRRRRNGQL